MLFCDFPGSFPVDFYSLVVLVPGQFSALPSKVLDKPILILSFNLGWPFLDPHSKKLIPLRNEEELRVSWNNSPSYRGSPGKAVVFDRHVKKDIGKP